MQSRSGIVSVCTCTCTCIAYGSMGHVQFHASWLCAASRNRYGSTILKQSQTVSNVYSKIWTCKQCRSNNKNHGWNMKAKSFVKLLVIKEIRSWLQTFRPSNQIADWDIQDVVLFNRMQIFPEHSWASRTTSYDKSAPLAYVCCMAR